MRREESCCTGSGLRGLKGVNLEVCLENRDSVRMTNRGLAVGGIMYLVCRIREKKKSFASMKKIEVEA